MCTVADSCQIYKDPPASKPDSGYGFIVELDQLTFKKPKKYVVAPQRTESACHVADSIVGIISTCRKLKLQMRTGA